MSTQFGVTKGYNLEHAKLFSVELARQGDDVQAMFFNTFCEAHAQYCGSRECFQSAAISNLLTEKAKQVLGDLV